MNTIHSLDFIIQNSKEKMNNYFSLWSDRILQLGIQLAEKHAKLRRRSVALSFGEVSYLCNRPSIDPHQPVILMLHGATADSSMWLQFCAQLKTPHTIVIIDFPGHGQSCAPLEMDYSIAAQTQRLREFFSALKIGSAHLIANSMGGAIALQLAALAPQLVASLILIDPAGVNLVESWMQEQSRDRDTHPVTAVQDLASFRLMVKVSMERPPYLPGFIAGALLRAFVLRSAVNLRIVENIESDLDQTAFLPKIQCKSLIIWGKEDRLLHVANAEHLHRQLAHSQLVILDGIGHCPMVETPKPVARLCEQFLSSH